MRSTTNLLPAVLVLVIVGGSVLAVLGFHALVGASRPGGVTNVTLTESDFRSNEQVKLLIAKANQILAKMKQDCAEHDLKFIGPTEFVPTEGRITQFDWEDYVGPRIELNNKDVTFEFWQSTNRLASFFNQDLDAVFYTKDAPHFDKPVTPKQTDQQGIQMAEAFLNVLEVPPDIKLGNPIAKFDQQMELPNYLLGRWRIQWARFDTKGHLFSPDIGVSVTIPEGYGPVSLAAGLNIPYTEEPGEPISQSDAIAKARAEIVSSRSGIHTSLIPNDKSIVSDKLLSSTLEIVEVSPQHSWSLWGAKPVRTARLAWVFWFDPVLANMVPGPTYDHRFMVSIDAFTGECVGTNAML